MNAAYLLVVVAVVVDVVVVGGGGCCCRRRWWCLSESCMCACTRCAASTGIPARVFEWPPRSARRRNARSLPAIFLERGAMGVCKLVWDFGGALGAS